MKDYEFSVGRTGKRVFAKIRPEADFVQSITEIFEKSGFVTASIPVAVGSLKKLHFTFVNSEGAYSTPVVKEGKFELVQASGFLSRVSGKTEVHIHASFADNEGRLFGGHLLERGNVVYATAEVMLDELSDIKFAKIYDSETGFKVFKIVVS